MYKKFYGFMLMAFASLMLNGCNSEGAFNGDPTPPPEVVKELVSIEVTPLKSTVIKGNSVQLTAKGTYSDGNEVDVTSSVTWTSSNPNKVKVTTDGLAKAITPGAVTISAEMEGITSNTVSVIAMLTRLNDTGQTWGALDLSGNNEDCSGNDFEAQDCSHGRDAQAAAGTLTKVGGGSAGFDFTKLDSNGSPLPVQDGTWSESGDVGLGTKWSCVQDNHTGFIWEVKTLAGLHHSKYTYTWYSTDITTNGGADGTPNSSIDCHDYANANAKFCNTQAFVARVNAASLCGHNDWRLPSRGELQSIVDYSKVNPAIDTDYFPNSDEKSYWSSSAVAVDSDYAWFVFFSYGDVSNVSRSNDLRVRLVRGGL